MASHADVLRTRLAHALVDPTASEGARTVEQSWRGGTVEPELIAPTANLGKFAAIHPTWASPGEKLPDGFSSCKAFSLNTKAVGVQLYEENIKKEMDYLHLCVVFSTGGKAAPKLLQCRPFESKSVRGTPIMVRPRSWFEMSRVNLHRSW